MSGMFSTCRAAATVAAPRVALVHDWLTGMRGGERCLEVACELFPDAPLFTLLHVPGSVSPTIERRRIVTSFVQRLPGAATRYRHYLPLFPAAVRGLPLEGFDVVLAVRAATRAHRRLLVVGRGPEEARLRALAGPSVTFLGWRSDAEVAELYARCRAVLFPSVEDFGIVPLEAAAAGRPTIALARGGALETMVGLEAGAPPTAVFFEEQTVDAVVAAMTRFEAAAHRFEPAALRAHAAAFDRPRFARQIREWVAGRWAAVAARGC